MLFRSGPPGETQDVTGTEGGNLSGFDSGAIGGTPGSALGGTPGGPLVSGLEAEADDSHFNDNMFGDLTNVDGDDGGAGDFDFGGSMGGMDDSAFGDATFGMDTGEGEGERGATEQQEQ